MRYVGILVASLSVLFAFGSVNAGDWRSQYMSKIDKRRNCCGIDDCIKIHARDVTYKPGEDTYYVKVPWGVEQVPNKITHGSHDNFYWYCSNKAPLNYFIWKFEFYCLFVPKGQV